MCLLTWTSNEILMKSRELCIVFKVMLLNGFVPLNRGLTWWGFELVFGFLITNFFFNTLHFKINGFNGLKSWKILHSLSNMYRNLFSCKN